eukprot:scaffold2042_cov250-Chaetoceros_neogracile.AAC.3
MRCCEEAFAPRRTLRNRTEQGLLGLSPSKGVLRPSTRFALQTQANPNPKRFYVVHFLANKIIRGRFWVLERTKVKSTFVRITTNNSKLSCSHR